MPALSMTPARTRALKHTLLITGRDGYTVALAIGELDSHYEGKSLILAYVRPMV